MKRRRHWLFWPLVLISVATCVWWTLRIPARPDSVYRVIPANASIVTVHDNLASRWGDVCGNPFTLTLLSALGLDAKDVRESPSDKDFMGWLKVLAPSRVVFAYVPSMQSSGEPAWVFASWLGGQSQRFRWFLSTGGLPGVRKAYDRIGHRVWVLDPAAFKLKTPDVISLSLVEGMLVGTISRRVATTADVLSCFDGQYPSLARKPSEIPPATMADRGWFELENSDKVLFQISAMSSQAISGTIHGPWTWPESTNAVSPSAVEDLAAVLGDAPMAYAVVDQDAALSWTRGRAKGAWADAVSLIQAEGRGVMALSLMGGDLSGRMRGIKLPTLLAGIPVTSETGALAAVSARFDTINARLQWGLVPQEIAVGPGRVQAIVSTADTFYAGFVESERVAYVATNHWLLFSSNLQGLTNLLQRPRARVRSMKGNAPVHGWINLAEGGGIRQAMSAWSLKLAMENPAGYKETFKKINEAKAWIEALAPLKTLRFSARPGDDGTTIEFAAGEEP